MSHPFVADCIAETAEASHKTFEMDGRLAASEAAVVEMLTASREAIALSHQLLAKATIDLTRTRPERR